MIVVVSGLPRSGTSMMMKMLEKAGLSILTDYIRESDDDNLLGYYEYEQVKNLDIDNSWLGFAEGKVVKIVSPLIKNITPDHNYKVIFMERNIEEILKSQENMMKNRGEDKKINDDEMKIIYEKHVKEIKRWLGKQKNIETLFVSYNETLKDPNTWALKIQDFLGLYTVDYAMTEVVNPDLYRQRKKETIQ